MNRERLEHLKTVMARVPPKNFFMGEWVSPSYEHPCNTTCCAGGWAALDQTFQTQGLSFVSRLDTGLTEDVKTLTDFYYITKKHGPHSAGFVIRYEKSFEGGALINFFGLTLNQGHYLFYTYEDDPSTESFIQRVDEVLQGEVE
jgi:hypothetical protein